MRDEGCLGNAHAYPAWTERHDKTSHTMNNTTQIMTGAAEIVGGLTSSVIVGIAFAVFVATIFLPLYVAGIYSTLRRMEKAQKYIFEQQEKLLIEIRDALRR
jgi:large-conductance mechanosensitive channel